MLLILHHLSYSWNISIWPDLANMDFDRLACRITANEECQLIAMQVYLLQQQSGSANSLLFNVLSISLPVDIGSSYALPLMSPSSLAWLKLFFMQDINPSGTDPRQ